VTHEPAKTPASAGVTGSVFPRGTRALTAIVCPTLSLRRAIRARFGRCTEVVAGVPTAGPRRSSVAVLTGDHLPSEPPGLPTRIAIVVPRSASIPAIWSEGVRRGDVAVFLFDLDPLEVVDDLVPWLGPAVFDLHYDQLLEAIVHGDSRLRPVRDLVTAILHDPLAIRWPCDLADSVGLPAATVGSRIRSAGFRRAGHFITVVRDRAIRLVRHATGMPARDVASWFGVSDQANFRRSRRAAGLCHESPDVTTTERTDEKAPP